MTLHADPLAWPHNYASVARLNAPHPERKSFQKSDQKIFLTGTPKPCLMR